jgi:hypothetical protein
MTLSNLKQGILSIFQPGAQYLHVWYLVPKLDTAGKVIGFHKMDTRASGTLGSHGFYRRVGASQPSPSNPIVPMPNQTLVDQNCPIPYWQVSLSHTLIFSSALTPAQESVVSSIYESQLKTTFLGFAYNLTCTISSSRRVGYTITSSGSTANATAFNLAASSSSSSFNTALSSKLSSARVAASTSIQNLTVSEPRVYSGDMLTTSAPTSAPTNQNADSNDYTVVIAVCVSIGAVLIIAIAVVFYWQSSRAKLEFVDEIDTGKPQIEVAVDVAVDQLANTPKQIPCGPVHGAI